MQLWQKIALGTLVAAGGALLAVKGKSALAGAKKAFTSGQQLAAVVAAFAKSKGVLYSYGGGHNNYVWPYGGKGNTGGTGRGAVGWDCSGWVRAVIQTYAPTSKAATQIANVHRASEIWERFGAPRNGLSGSKPGDIVFWGSGPDHISHIGFLSSVPGRAVSAMGAGEGVNANVPTAMVKEHGAANVGSSSRPSIPIGTSSWL